MSPDGCPVSPDECLVSPDECFMTLDDADECLVTPDNASITAQRLLMSHPSLYDPFNPLKPPFSVLTTSVCLTISGYLCLCSH